MSTTFCPDCPNHMHCHLESYCKIERDLHEARRSDKNLLERREPTRLKGKKRLKDPV